MSADSAHKTLPALTGAAYLHISRDFLQNYNNEYTVLANEAMSLFGTSSPSYLILESLDLCNRHIADEKSIAESAFAAVSKLKQDLIKIGYILNESDLLRITIDVNLYGYTGFDYAIQLQKHGIVCEMRDSRFIILLFSTITKEKNTQRVFEAMMSIPPKKPLLNNQISVNCQLSTVNCRKAFFSKKRKIPVNQAIGEICAGVHVSIPPCVPLIIPGEIISAEIAMVLKNSGVHEIDVIAV
jgi:arginine/lysine/ornithine decarboxylase